MFRKYTLSLLAPFKRAVFGVVTFALVASLFSAADPLVLKFLFDALAHGNGKAIPIALGLLLGAELSRSALSAWVNAKNSEVKLAVDLSLRDRLIKKLTAVSSDYHQAEGVGATMNKVTQIVASFTTALGEVLLNLLPSLAYLSIAVVAMWRMNWILALVVLALAPLAPVIGALAAREQTSRERNLTDRSAQMYSRLHEVLSGIRVVQIFGMEREERRRFIREQREGHQIAARGQRTDAITASARSVSVALARLAAIAAGSILIMKGQLTLGSLLAFLAYVGGMLTPVQSLTNLYQTLRKGSVAVEMMHEVFESPSHTTDPADAKNLEHVAGELRFHDVTFAHESGPVVFDRFNLHVQAGESVAVVGPSGSGKTTLTDLLLRLYPVESGTISIDGNDISEVTAESLRRNIAYVAEDIHLFNDTVRANIAYANPKASDEEIEDAARQAHAHEFIGELPQGYDTLIGERGGRLSGGQRQRLAIARALLKKASILVMDEEATSALDVKSEAVLQDSIERLRKGRTTLIAAHRLSTVLSADRIVVLQDGKSLASGTHDELLSSNPYYADLVGSSTGGLLGAEPEDRPSDFRGEADT